jgi:hypothetical protein
MSDIISYSELQHNIAKSALVKPTYAEIMSIFEGDVKIEETRKQIDELKQELHLLPRGPKRSALAEEIDSLLIWTDLLLPNDFLAFVVAYSLGVDKSDIKKISEDALIHAALLAQRGHDNPADHLEGKFTAFMRDDINMRAWYLLEEEKKGKRNGC